MDLRSPTSGTRTGDRSAAPGPRSLPQPRGPPGTPRARPRSGSLAHPGAGYLAAGRIFWLTRKKFSGSYAAFTAASRG